MTKISSCSSRFSLFVSFCFRFFLLIPAYSRFFLILSISSSFFFKFHYRSLALIALALFWSILAVRLAPIMLNTDLTVMIDNGIFSIIS